jgi:hypothetical protein
MAIHDRAVAAPMPFGVSGDPTDAARARR